MIPTTFARRIAAFLMVVVVAGMLMTAAAALVTRDEDLPFAQTVAGMVFLMLFYGLGPQLASFLAPKSQHLPESTEISAAKARIGQRALPVVLYANSDQGAVTVGVLESQARIYLTNSMLAGLSTDGLCGVLAHESTHIKEHHILICFAFACGYALVSHAVDDFRFFAVGYTAFMALRRYMEYRADAGAATCVGKAATVRMLEELHLMYPTRSWSRFFVYASPYPTIQMRIDAIVSGKRVMF